MSSELKEAIEICRLCANSAENTDENDLFAKSNKLLLQQIKDLTGITLKNTSCLKLPRHFCEKCKESLSCAYEFRRKIIKSQSYFKSKDYQVKFGNLNSVRKQENVEHKFDTVYVSSYNDEAVDIKCFPDQPFSHEDEDFINIKNESNDSTEGIQWPIHRRLKKEQKDILDAKSNSFPIKDEVFYNNDNSLAASKDSSGKDNEDSEDSDSVATFNEEKTSMLANKDPQRKVLTNLKKEADNENQLDCQICQRSFKAHSLLKLHWRKEHKGEKKFKCELCQEMFFTIKSLTRHSGFHKGEKAYKCHYCDLTFTYSSHRTRHERKMHSRDCAFLCTLCGKSFTTHDMGYRHMVVHTKERAFQCTVCKTSFLRKTHLTTHYRSETHKNNERKLNEEKELLQVKLPELNNQFQGDVQDQTVSQIVQNNLASDELILQQQLK